MQIYSPDANDWWKKAVFYQIYPRSFYDSNNDGIGDLAGITQKLDYLNDGNGGGLGIDAIWISPFFTSPMKDFGYDVSNYCDVDPIFGNLDDFENLTKEAHKRGVKIVIDLVLNHCSDQHPWFQESKKDRENSKSDWYLWKDGTPEQGPPNNWLSVFGGSAWTYDENRKQYYYHSFLKEQPDLNWSNAEVREEIRKVIRFWIDKGVDGFRLDTANFYAHDQEFRDNPLLDPSVKILEPRDNVDYDKYESSFSKDRPENFDCLKLIRQTMDEATDRPLTTIGEIGGIQDLTKLIPLATSYVQGNEHLHMAYTFSLLSENLGVPEIANVLKLTEESIGDGWPCWSMGNHDVMRVFSRFQAEEKTGIEQLAMLFLLSMRGTPIIYYGDELGMPNYEVMNKEELQDPFGITYWPEYKGRDGCRTPFPWDDNLKNQGFNEGEKPWLPAKSPVALAQNQEIYHLTQEMIQYRKSSKALMEGTYQLVQADSFLVFDRIAEGQTIRVFCNFSSDTVQAEVENGGSLAKLQSFSNEGAFKGEKLELPPFGFAMLELS